MRAIKVLKEEAEFEEKPKHHQFLDLTDEVFGRLTVIGYAGHSSKGSKNQWWCKCSCNDKYYIRTYIGSLRSAGTGSCGCFHTERASESHKTHGLESSPEYNSYRAMIERCRNPNCKIYQRYGGRGIELKFESFIEFYNEIGDRPEPKHLYSVERINNEGHYEPGNVKWATRKEQANNTRQVHKLEYKGEIKTYSEWSDILGLASYLIYKRIRRGWCAECALTIPKQLNFQPPKFIGVKETDKKCVVCSAETEKQVKT